MPGRRLADARGGEHALALDLDHAGAAIAVGAVAGLRQPAQMRDLDAVRGCATCQIVSPGAASTSAPSSVKRIGSVIAIISQTRRPGESGPRHRPVAAVDPGFRGIDESSTAHRFRSSRKCFSTCLTGFIAAWPRPQIEASLITCAARRSSGSSQRGVGHQLDRLLGADAARRALAAALVLEEAHQVERHRLHVVLVGQHDDRAPSR